VAIVLSLAAGSVFAGHVNDSGFWLASRFFGMDVKTTLKVWTVGQALVGVIGFGIAYLIYAIATAFQADSTPYDPHTQLRKIHGQQPL
jgi:GntP family gluconate:H+ symporter